MKYLLVAIALLIPQLANAQPRYVRGIHVAAPPPALRYESPPPAPSSRHQWIAGYWGWRGGAHVWMPGTWALPPAPGYAWEPARWDNGPNGWTFYDGHWRSLETADPEMAYQPPPPPVQQVVVESPPPAVYEEERGVAPFPNALWMPGYWNWAGGRHVWVAGRWSAHPAGYEWDAHHWEHGPDGRWRQHPGHWDHH